MNDAWVYDGLQFCLDVFHPATSHGGFRSCNWMTAVFASHMKSKAFLPSAAQLGVMYIAWL